MNIKEIKALETLRALDNWVVRNDKKVPFTPKNGAAASSADPRTWGSFRDAEKALETGRYAGLGFQLGNSGYCCIDLDHAFCGGEISPFAAEIVSTMDSYTEVSPSGNGLHILVKTDPLDRCGHKTPKGAADAIEIYRPVAKQHPSYVGEVECGRYITISGIVYGEEKPVAERTGQMEELIRRYFPASVEKPSCSTTQLPCLALLPQSDRDVIDKMFSSKCSLEIKALWNGDLSITSGDHSSADLALVNRLAYWTNGDEAQMDRLFRQSGLYASMKEEHGIKKWDRRHGGGTYGEMTIAKALKGFVPYRQEIRAPLAPHPPANVKTPSPEQTYKEVEP